MPDKYTKEAEKLLPKKKYCAYNKKWQSTYPKDCQNIGYAKSIADCTPIVADLLEKIDELKAGSIEVGVEEIEEIIETWFVKQESILSNEQIKEVDTKGVWQVDLKSLSFDEIKKGLAQAILNNNKEKE